jgi:hypothetical protein
MVSLGYRKNDGKYAIVRDVALRLGAFVAGAVVLVELERIYQARRSPPASRR